MDLYRIILVDDEEEVRQSIIRKINWTEAGFQVVGDAENMGFSVSPSLWFMES